MNDLPPYYYTKADNLKLGLSKRVSLTTRILVVNVFVLLLMVFGLFALDAFQKNLFDERLKTSRIRLDSIAEILTKTSPEDRASYIIGLGKKNNSRLRLYNIQGDKLIDNFLISKPTYALRNPDEEPIEKIAARYLDYAFNFLVLAPKLQYFKEPKNDILSSWQNILSIPANRPYSTVMNADDLSPIIFTIAQTKDKKYTLIETVNAHDLRIKVRSERATIFTFFLIILTISILLSLFLARTIVRPIQYLAASAVKVKLGRSPHVTLPRLPERRDEIGMLARALSDMNIALHKRIDRTQSFADDVAHEIKNPLASLRSALEGLQTIKDPKLSKQLLDIAHDDILRMDRLITDIAEIGKVDFQIARAQFEKINIDTLIDNIIKNYKERINHTGAAISLTKRNKQPIFILGEQIRIARVLENLIDNALSFSASNTPIEIFLKNRSENVVIRVSDKGPGIKEDDYEKIFQRFYSSRPAKEDFGKNSGLGLAISRAIIEAHSGTIFAKKRFDGKQGACFEIQLPVVN